MITPQSSGGASGSPGPSAPPSRRRGARVLLVVQQGARVPVRAAPQVPVLRALRRCMGDVSRRSGRGRPTTTGWARVWARARLMWRASATLLLVLAHLHMPLMVRARARKLMVQQRRALLRPQAPQAPRVAGGGGYRRRTDGRSAWRTPGTFLRKERLGCSQIKRRSRQRCGIEASC